MSSIAMILSKYAACHQNKINKITHFIGIPCILISIQILFSWITLPFIQVITLSWVVCGLLLLYYLYLDLSLGFVSCVFLLSLTYLSSKIATQQINSISLYIALTLFFGGWMLQFLGHFFEGKKPAFMENLMQVFIAPMFIITEICLLLGFREDVRRELDKLLK